MSKLIYLDNAATTKTAPEVVEGYAFLILQNTMEILPAYIALQHRIKK